MSRRASRSAPLTCIATLACTLAACRERDEYSYVDHVVWSDDGEEVMFAIQRFDVTYPRNMPREDRNENYRFEVWTSALDGTNLSLWRDRDGEVSSIYDMRSAGYVLIEHYSRVSYKGSTFELLRAPDEVALAWDSDGHDDVCEGCRIDNMLPSPTGALIAVRYWSESLSVHAFEILEADDGTRAWGPVVLDAELGDSFWSEHGEHFVRGHDGIAWRWTEGAEDLEEVTLPKCRPPLAPPTTSSRIDAMGRILCATWHEEDVHVCECQELPQESLAWCYAAEPFGCAA